MTNSERDRLFNEVCLGDQYNRLKAESLEQGLSCMRQARRRKRLLRSGYLACIPLLLSMFLLIKMLPEDPAHPKMADIIPNKPATGSLNQEVVTPGVEIINEAEFLELLAQYPGPAVAVIRGQNKEAIVLLGEREDEETP